MKRNAGVLLLLLCACSAAPREVEVTVTLGAEQVEVKATLHDLRVWTRDPAEALLAFQEIHGPEASLVTGVYRDHPWLPSLRRWAWRVQDETLDLTLEGVMPRSRFDACVASPLKEGSRSEPIQPPACKGFPLWRDGDTYRSMLDLRSWASAEEGWMPLGATRWPLHEIQFQTRALVANTLRAGMRQSALPSYELQVLAPEAVSSYARLVERLRKAFREGDTEECKRLQAEAARDLTSPVLALFESQLRRERLSLIEALLLQQGQAPVKSLPSPPGDMFGSLVDRYPAELLPRQRPPELLLLRLFELHARAMVRFGVDGSDGTEDFTAWLDESSLDGLCEQLRRKVPAWKRPCQHLLGTRP